MLPLTWVLLVPSTLNFASTRQIAPQQDASQQSSKPPSEPGVIVLGRTPPLHLNTAESLYMQLRGVELDPARVYHARDVQVDREALAEQWANLAERAWKTARSRLRRTWPGA